MSSYYTRWCAIHGEWDDDVDNPSECPECLEAGTAPSQLEAKEKASLRAELAVLREENQKLRLASEDLYALTSDNARMREALETIRDDEGELCHRCEGNGAVYADGKAHLYSSGAATVACPACDGAGRISGPAAREIAEAAISTPAPADQQMADLMEEAERQHNEDKAAGAFVTLEQLREIEYVATPSDQPSGCPACGWSHIDGHRPDCWLAAAIKRAEETCTPRD